MSTAPGYLAPTSRFAGDAWTDTPGGLQNALRYIVWQTPPLYGPDGVTIVTPGVPQNLTGWSVSGTFYYQTRCGVVPPMGLGTLPVPVGTVVDPLNAIISLSLTAAQSVFPKQSLALWASPAAALLIAQPRVVDASGSPGTVGLQQVFVF